MPLKHYISCCLVILFAASGLSRAEEVRVISPEHAEFFEKKIRSLLMNECYECHSSDEAESELQVDSLAALLHGGERGPAIVVGKPEESLLISAVKHADQLQMPPKSKIEAEEIEALATWVKMGAPWPNSEDSPAFESASKQSGPLFTEEETNFWAFRKPKWPALADTKSKSWSTSPIDSFVLSRLEAAGLSPAKPATPRALIRRATFDLTGLPPTVEEVNDFLADRTPEAFERVIDRLLRSPRYGERWGRHWLDVARYADSNGLDENIAYANAFRYRDYVIRAFNEDKPYDRFIVE